MFFSCFLARASRSPDNCVRLRLKKLHSMEAVLANTSSGSESTFYCKVCAQTKDKQHVYISRFVGMSCKDTDFTNDDQARTRSGPDAQIQEGDTFLCIQCHRLNGRIGRVLNNQGLSADFHMCPNASKQKLMSDAANLFGEDLCKKLNQTIMEAKIQKQLTSFDNTGVFKDKVDLEEKYAKKPEVLANILANAQQFFCPIRRCTMYSDPEYKLQDTHSSEISRTIERSIEQEAKVKPAKRARTAPKKAAAAGVEGGDPKIKPLSEAQKIALNTLKEKTDKMNQEGEALTKRLGSHGVVHHVPGFVVQKFETALSALVAAKASTDLAVELGSCNLQSLRQEVATAMKDLKTQTPLLENAIEAAEEHLGVGKEPSAAAVAAGA